MQASNTHPTLQLSLDGLLPYLKERAEYFVQRHHGEHMSLDSFARQTFVNTTATYLVGELEAEVGSKGARRAFSVWTCKQIARHAVNAGL